MAPNGAQALPQTLTLSTIGAQHPGSSDLMSIRGAVLRISF